jgi:hypothetical protein
MACRSKDRFYHIQSWPTIIPSLFDTKTNNFRVEDQILAKVTAQLKCWLGLWCLLQVNRANILQEYFWFARFRKDVATQQLGHDKATIEKWGLSDLFRFIDSETYSKFV